MSDTHKVSCYRYYDGGKISDEEKKNILEGHVTASADKKEGK